MFGIILLVFAGFLYFSGFLLTALGIVGFCTYLDMVHASNHPENRVGSSIVIGLEFVAIIYMILQYIYS